MQKGLNKWLEREEGSDDKKKKKNEAGGKNRGGNKMLPCVFWRLSFCLK